MFILGFFIGYLVYPVTFIAASWVVRKYFRHS